MSYDRFSFKNKDCQNLEPQLSNNYPTTIQQLSSNIQQLSNNMTKLHFNIIQPSNIHPTRSNPPDPQSYWASWGIASAKDSEITRKLEKIGKVWHLK